MATINVESVLKYVQSSCIYYHTRMRLFHEQLTTLNENKNVSDVIIERTASSVVQLLPGALSLTAEIHYLKTVEAVIFYCEFRK